MQRFSGLWLSDLKQEMLFQEAAGFENSDGLPKVVEKEAEPELSITISKKMKRSGSLQFMPRTRQKISLRKRLNSSRRHWIYETEYWERGT